MFIDIDEFKKSQKAKYFLAKPNFQIVASLSDKSNDDANFKLGNVGDLNLTIPYYIEDNQMMIKNENIDMVKEKMLIKMVLGTQVEWYIIDEITDEGNEEELSIKAFSLPYELTHKRVSEYIGDAVTAREFLTENLSETIWRIGVIDARFDNVYRSFEVNDSNVLETIIEGAEAFGALIDWNTSTRTISFLDLEKNGQFKGMTVNYGELLTSFSRNRTTDEMVTRLYVYGNEDLTIHGVNPTGQGYIEDFSFFMYPFERDSNKNIIKSSYLMSDELCMALLDLEELTKVFAENYKDLSISRSLKQTEFIELETALADLNNNLENLELELDTAKSVTDTGLIEELNAEIEEINVIITLAISELDAKEIEIANIDTQIQNLNIKLQADANFTEELLNELNLYIIEREWRDDRYIDEQELYDDAIKKFNEIREPKVVITIGLENLLEVVEEQYYWNKLVLGDYIKIKYPQMNINYKAKIIEINYNFDSGDVSLTIANTTNIGDDMDSLNKILYSSQSASTLITNNKYKWDKVGEIEDEVYKLLNEEWDATKKRITAGVDNSIEIGKRGIIIQSPSYPNEVVIMQSGVIALSENSGDTWKTAITAKGIIADRLMGNVLIGRNLIMTNANGDFTFDESGLKINSQKMNIRNPDGSYMTFADFESGISGDIENVSASITQTATDIRQEVNADIKTVNGSINTLQSSINTGIGRIDMVVSSTNQIKGEAIASAIAVTPRAISLISENINLTGKVTFGSLDQSVVSSINSANSTASSAFSTANSALNTANSANGLVNSWKMPNKTTINGGNIETGTIQVGRLTSTNGYSKFEVEAGSAKFTDSNNAYMHITPNSLMGYSSGGTNTFRVDKSIVTSSSFGTSKYNVYLGTYGEVRIVDYDSMPSDGDVNSYSYKNLRCQAINAYGHINTDGNVYSGGYKLATELYVRDNFLRTGTSEAQITGSVWATYASLGVGGYPTAYANPSWTTLGNSNVYIPNAVYANYYRGNSGGSLRIGSDSTGAFVQSESIFDRTYGTSMPQVCITSSGTLGRISSSRKYKVDIQDANKEQYPKILNLTPRTWYDKNALEGLVKYKTMTSDVDMYGNPKKSKEPDNIESIYLERAVGLIAEEVIDAGLGEFVIYGEADEHGNREPEGLMYDRLWTMLIPIVKDNKEKIEELETKNKSLESRLNKLEELVQNLIK